MTLFSKNSINAIIRTLIISDFFLFFATGLLTPIYAVFIIENIGADLTIIGYAVTCYWLTRVVMVIPFSWLMDRMKGETDEYFFMTIGTFLISLVALLYTLSSLPWHIYVLQVLNGLAHAMAVPAWRIMFTNHIDRHIVGFEWSLEDVGVGIATAASATIGALVVSTFGFNTLFVMIFFFGTISALILLTLNRDRKNILMKFFRNRPNKVPLKIDSFK